MQGVQQTTDIGLINQPFVIGILCSAPISPVAMARSDLRDRWLSAHLSHPVLDTPASSYHPCLHCEYSRHIGLASYVYVLESSTE